MRIFLPLLVVLCAAPVRNIHDGTCPRKDPPSGTLVLSPGSKLVLTCSGHVTVDRVKVRNSSNSHRRVRSVDPTEPSAAPTTVNIISNSAVTLKSGKHTTVSDVGEGYHSKPTETGERRSIKHTDAGYTLAPTAPTDHPTVDVVSQGEDMHGAADYEDEEDEEEEEGESRVTRAIKVRPQWKWNGRTVGRGDKDWGEITFERAGTALSLSSVRVDDSGTYMCFSRGRERFSLRVIVTDPPEKPKLSCYKKSPNSKIRCEWTPQKPVTLKPSCYLLLSKGPTEAFHRIQCSFSSRTSRCWCAMEHDDDKLRSVHTAYLCVTNIAGNATSTLVQFTPLRILKPDPPSNVFVRQEEGQETRIKVTWGLPISWKPQDNYYELIYEVKYRPLKSSFDQEQVQLIRGQRWCTITDALPGEEYLIQLRAKEEYDGHWSEWSSPECGRSWTAPISTTTMTPDYADIEGSGTEANVTDDSLFTSVSTKPDEVSLHVLWIPASFVLLSAFLAAYIFRHKDRFESKLQSLSVITQCADSPQPPPAAPTGPEEQALVTLSPARYKEPPLSDEEEAEEENEEEQCVNQRTQAVHLHNASYFFIQQ
ncbi:uncharacterized protein V6R79_008247 [Siganus canaliculatus]